MVHLKRCIADVYSRQLNAECAKQSSSTQVSLDVIDAAADLKEVVLLAISGNLTLRHSRRGRSQRTATPTCSRR
jgi:cytolysin (calcineurin-like family phosphatase)